MKGVAGLTVAFALAASLLARTGWPEPSDYALSVPRSPNGTATTYDILAKGLARKDCATAFDRRDRALYPSSTAVCASIFDAEQKNGLILRENTNAKGEILIEEYPSSSAVP